MQGSGPRNVNVLDKNGRIHLGWVFSDSTSQGTELLIPVVDSLTNQVGFNHENGRYGKNFCEIGEDTSVLGSEEKEAFKNKTNEEFVAPAPKEVKTKTEGKKQHKR